MGTPLAQLHRDLIISLAAKHRLPAVYFERFFVTDGGLISYGADFVDQYRRAVVCLTVSSMAINRPICRCRLRTNMNLSSISKPPRRLASACHLAARPRRRGDRDKQSDVRYWHLADMVCAPR